MTQVTTSFWIRSVIYCFDKCECIASWESITNYYHILYASLINADTISDSLFCVQRSQSFHFHQRQITNLIPYGVVNGVNSAYNTTITPNESSFHQFTCIVSWTQTTETSLFFGSFVVHTTAPCLYPNNTNIKFISVTRLLHVHARCRFHDYDPLWNAYYSSISTNTNSLDKNFSSSILEISVPTVTAWLGEKNADRFCGLLIHKSYIFTFQRIEPPAAVYTYTLLKNFPTK